MIKSYSQTEIVFDKELNRLDKFVLDFIKLLGEIKYVVVSGYVAILFGRTRATEDIDLIIQDISRSKFEELAKRVWEKGYWFINGDNIETLYAILREEQSLRIAKKGEWLPNMEIKFARDEIDEFCLTARVKVTFSGESIYISPIELQIAYKLKLGSDKDIEDALHLFQLFKKYLSAESLLHFIRLLKVEVPEWLNFRKR